MCSKSVVAYAVDEAKVGHNQVFMRHQLLSARSALKLSHSAKGVLRHYNCTKLLGLIVSVFRQLSYGGGSFGCQKFALCCQKFTLCCR